MGPVGLRERGGTKLRREIIYQTLLKDERVRRSLTRRSRSSALPGTLRAKDSSSKMALRRSGRFRSSRVDSHECLRFLSVKLDLEFRPLNQAHTTTRGGLEYSASRAQDEMYKIQRCSSMCLICPLVTVCAFGRTHHLSVQLTMPRMRGSPLLLRKESASIAPVRAVAEPACRPCGVPSCNHQISQRSPLSTLPPCRHSTTSQHVTPHTYRPRPRGPLPRPVRPTDLPPSPRPRRDPHGLPRSRGLIIHPHDPRHAAL